MKATGIVRKVDELGRIVLPVEMRENMGIVSKDSIEIFVDGDKIILQKYKPSCIFCDKVDGTVYYQSKLICTDCISKISKNFN